MQVKRPREEPDVFDVDTDTGNEDMDEEPAEQGGAPSTRYIKLGDKQILKATLARHVVTYPWIFVAEDGLRCKLCQWNSGKNLFVQKGFTQVKKIVDALSSHADGPIHSSSLSRDANTLQILLEKRSEYNLEQMHKICSSLFFEVKQGRLKEVLAHYAKAMRDGDFVEWMQQDVHYLSAGTILELLFCIGDVLKEDVCKLVEDADWWGTCADGTDDVTRTHKIITTVKLLKNGVVSERFHNLQTLYDKTGVGHAKAFFEGLGLNGEEKLTALRKTFVGIALDGTSSMSSDRRGAQQCFRTKLQCASVYCWCAGHLLQLASTDACGENPKLKDFFAVLRKLWVFFSGSQARTAALDAAFEKMAELCDGILKKILEPSTTRWLSHSQCVKVVQGMLPAIVATLQQFQDSNLDAEVLLRKVKCIIFCVSVPCV